jgi:hypothetical protein
MMEWKKLDYSEVWIASAGNVQVHWTTHGYWISMMAEGHFVTYPEPYTDLAQFDSLDDAKAFAETFAALHGISP